MPEEAREGPEGAGEPRECQASHPVAVGAGCLIVYVEAAAPADVFVAESYNAEAAAPAEKRSETKCARMQGDARMERTRMQGSRNDEGGRCEPRAARPVHHGSEGEKQVGENGVTKNGTPNIVTDALGKKVEKEARASTKKVRKKKGLGNKIQTKKIKCMFVKERWASRVRRPRRR